MNRILQKFSRAARIALVGGALFTPYFLSAQQAGGHIKKGTVNFNAKGEQLTRYSTLGDAIDAHDGEIAYFGDTYYLYGTSYDCGFEWGNKGAPFCGFKVYTSKDMHNWTDRGMLFDAETDVWQSRCDGKTYGCFRPHVIYNARTRNYVLWINVYDNVVGYRVFTSKNPAGPFTEVAEPKLAVNAQQPAAGLNNGDHDLFVDDDGTAYLALTDWRKRGSIAIEKLSDDYLSGTGEVAENVTDSLTEAPGMFKRNGRYYVLYSDPNCGYCSGTGTSYKTARSPLGPWSEGRKISDNSCGGQPSFVSTIKLKGGDIFLYGSDLWNNAAKNEALANFFWSALEFDGEGAIKPILCNPGSPAPLVASSETRYEIRRDTQQMQVFIPEKTGTIAQISLTLYKRNAPEAPLSIAIIPLDDAQKPAGPALFHSEISSAKLGWSPKKISIAPKIRMQSGKRYGIVLSTKASTGAYGALISAETAPKNRVLSSPDGGKTYRPEKEHALKLDVRR
ncbi:MAG: family 43 glycosylhydrolase [Mucilaginibacter polytrichastri]|nr:family 43 glycosylhydrolase [Mucilaginibacter polytrichastri]